METAQDHAQQQALVLKIFNLKVPLQVLVRYLNV
jgi:hypothetical protein